MSFNTFFTLILSMALMSRMPTPRTNAGYARKCSLSASFKIADKLFPAGFTKIIPCAVAFFPVAHYVWVIAARAIGFYVDYHSYIVALFVLAVFLFHHTLYITFDNFEYLFLLEKK
jgi:hypothetical protein